MMVKIGKILENQNIFSHLTKECSQEVCQKHGSYTSTSIFFCGELKSKSTCPVCNQERHEAFRREYEKQKRDEKIQKNLQNSRIPKEYREKSLQTFLAETENEKKNLEVCQRFVDNWSEKVLPNGYGILMFGGCGTGKTHLSTSMLKELIQTEKAYGFYTTVREVIDKIRETWNNFKEPEKKQQVLDYFQRTPLVVIDEIGVQAGTQNERDILFSILDYRVMNSRPTVLISNLNKADLKNLLGERLYDRICSKCVPLIFTGASKRKHLSNKNIPF